MLKLLPRSWWAVVLRGLSAAAFGLLALFWPSVTLGVLMLLFAPALRLRQHGQRLSAAAEPGRAVPA